MAWLCQAEECRPYLLPYLQIKEAVVSDKEVPLRMEEHPCLVGLVICLVENPDRPN